MIEPSTTLAGLGLIFILGLRHGLDPDHVAVIDNITFKASDERPSLAPWVGTLFALGHSLSVAIVAIGVAFLANQFSVPEWLTAAIDWLIIALLLLVGTMNLRALMRADRYQPIGWRHAFVPRRLRDNTNPFAIIAIGAIFGLVFDTATQAAAWGAAAGASGAGVVAIILAFSAGMILTDTADSWIVARLLRTQGDRRIVQRYRRMVGWVIVGLSFGMAGYALATLLAPQMALGDIAFSSLGIGMVVVVILLLAVGAVRAKPKLR